MRVYIRLNIVCVTYLKNECFVEEGIASLLFYFGLLVPPLVRQKVKPHERIASIDGAHRSCRKVFSFQNGDEKFFRSVFVTYGKPQTTDVIIRKFQIFFQVNVAVPIKSRIDDTQAVATE